jgi:metal-responsive CopG/Arc/MetJ family transcriptional regulator
MAIKSSNTRIAITLPERIVQRLDAEAEERGINKSTIILLALEEYQRKEPGYQREA